jgi:alpha-glucosidase
MARSSFESAVKYGKGKRPFVLTRSGFAGVQRYAAVWTGDNTAKDEYLLGGALLNTQMGLSGVPFVGDDIGGYIGPASKELFTRWMQVGMFSPYARNHKEAYAQANEPWSFGEETEGIAKAFMEFRYRLMPYLYSAFYEASQTGMPIARSLCINYPFDEKVYHNLYQYQFMCGPALMVVPVSSSEKNKSYYLPAGQWYNIYNDDVFAGSKEYTSPVPFHQLPVFVKASSILPMQSTVQSNRQKPSDTLYMHVYYGAEKNIFTWYEDDGETMAYHSAEYHKRDIVFDPGGKRLGLSKVGPDSTSLGALAEHISTTERSAADAEKESVKLKKLEFFQIQAASEKRQKFRAVIMDARNFGLFVELPEFLLTGLVHISALEGDFFVHDAPRCRLVGRRTKKVYQVGDIIEVAVDRVDMFKQQVDFKPAS